jgi:hypothetical protein
MSIVDQQFKVILMMSALLNGDNLKQNYRDVVGDNPKRFIGHKMEIIT